MRTDALFRIVLVVAGIASIGMLGSIVWLLTDGETTPAISMIVILIVGYVILGIMWARVRGRC